MTIFSDELLKAHGYTCYSLAKTTGIAITSIYRYRDGKLAPELRNARKIATTLGIQLDDLGFPREQL